MSSVDLKDFLAGYLVEVEEHLRQSVKLLLEIERQSAGGAPISRLVRELFRSMHTVKGLSAMVGIEPVVDIAHGLEAALRSAAREGPHLAPADIDLLVQGVRAIDVRVRAVASGHAVPPAPAAIVDGLAAMAERATIAAPAPPALTLPDELAGKLTPGELSELASGDRRAVRVDFVPTPARAERGINITSIRERLGRVGDLVKVIPLSVTRSEQAPGGIAFAILLVTAANDRALAEAAEVEPSGVVTLRDAAPSALDHSFRVDESSLEDDTHDVLAESGRIVRVPVARLDDVLDRLSALVISRSRLARSIAGLAANGVDVREVTQILQENGRHLRDLRASIMRARMVAVTELLERVPLIVRGLSRATGKEVALEIEAGRAELDKSVGERLFPAIVHLVRNAVDHAIETPDERAALGKPRAGRVRVECRERSNNQLELSVSDDGGGIDRERVANAAGRAVPATDDGLLDLLTIPGLSTRERATTTSGRGVGMDIVKRIAVDQLGGELILSTEPGVGTTFSLRVPLTITIVDAFSFECADQAFVVPVSMVEEILDLEPQRLTTPPQSSAHTQRPDVVLFDHRGEAIPVADLDVFFSLTRAPVDRRKAILVRRAGRPFAFGVDRMLGQQEVVIRPVDDPLVKVASVIGSTDLGDGRPTLVLDLLALSASMSAPPSVEAIR